MSDNKTREELNTYDFDTLVNLVVTLQYRLSDKEKSELELKEELKGLRQESIELNKKMQYLIEQIAINKRRKYGRYSEKFEDINGQISFEDIDEAFDINYHSDEEELKRLFDLSITLTESVKDNR